MNGRIGRTTIPVSTHNKLGRNVSSATNLISFARAFGKVPPFHAGNSAIQSDTQDIEFSARNSWKSPVDQQVTK